MQILFCTPAFSPFPGGGERYVRSLALQLAQGGHRLTIVTTAARTEQELWMGSRSTEIATSQEEGLRIVRCPLRPLPGKRIGLLAWRKCMVMLSALPGDRSALLLKMARLIPPIRKIELALAQLPDQIDLVHGFNISWEHALVAGWLYAREHDLPYVITPFTHLGVAGKDNVARNSTMDHQRRILNDACAVLTLTGVEKAGLVELGIRPERINVVGGAVDPPPAVDAPHLIQRQFDLSPPYFIFVGRHSYDKGAIHAAQAIIKLRRQGHSARLALVGQNTAEFERFFHRLSESDRDAIRPLGILPEHEKHGLLQGAVALLLPSRTDSFGIVLLEAWAHGLPVIGARAGGIPGVIDEGQDGLLISFGGVTELAQAVERLLLDQSLGQRLGQSGLRKVSSEYSWSQVGSRVLANYRRVLAPTRTG